MTDPRPDGPGDDLFMTVRLVGGTPAERLLMIRRVDDEGRVSVREWTTATMHSPGEDYEVLAAELLEELEDEDRAHHLVGTEMYRVRRWLSGGA